MRRRYLIFFVLIIGVCSGCSGVGRRVKTEEVPQEEMVVEVPSKKLPVGEKLLYKIRWLGMTVGEGTLWIKEIVTVNGQEAYHVIAEARSNKILNPIYKIEDRVETFIDVKGLYALKFIKDQREGRYRAHEVVEFDHEKGIGYYKSLTNGSEKEFKITRFTQDTLSCLYYFRTLKLEIGKPVFVNVSSDEKNWEVRVDILEGARVAIRGLGEYEAVMIEPVTEMQGVIIRKGRMIAWVSSDEHRYPLTVQTEAPIMGKVIACLDSIEKIDDTSQE
ncbi:MAG: DUF3108 domain-containing protein [Candidatus Omnitrophica bacterium]|nr:DUF3108 domain-containing protein [Candidatus Omnitrophota bacterium]